MHYCSIQKTLFIFCPFNVRNRVITRLFIVALFVKVKNKNSPNQNNKTSTHTYTQRGKITPLHIKSQQLVYIGMLQNKEQVIIHLSIVHNPTELNLLLRDTNRCGKLYVT